METKPKEKVPEIKVETKKQKEKKKVKKDPRAYTFTREVKEVCVRFD